MKKESMVGRRLYAWILDTILLFILVFLFDAFVSQPISSKVTNIDQITTSYVENSSRYEEIQDEYQIYIYDENNERIYNENVTEETKNNFLKDERILELNEILMKEQEQILSNYAGRLAISILVPSLVIYCGLPLILKKGKTFGRATAKLFVISNNDYITWYKSLLRGLVTIVLDVYLGILSLGMLPLISLVCAILQKDNKTLVDLLCKTDVVDGKLPL